MKKTICILISFILLQYESESQSLSEVDSTEFWTTIRPIEDSMGKAYSFWQVAAKANWKEINADSVYNEYSGLRNQYLARFAAFVKANPDNWTALEYFSLYIMNRRTIRLDSIRLMFSNFNENLRKSPRGLFIDSALNRKISLSIDKPAPVFSIQATDGINYGIDSFRGKYVLLCFWASWCGPCVKNIPMLKTINEEYGDKVQMISISIDKDEKKWKEALDKYKMNWIQACDIPPYNNNNQLMKTYDINFIPEYILLDGEGRIVYQNYILRDDSYEILKKKLNDIK